MSDDERFVVVRFSTLCQDCQEAVAAERDLVSKALAEMTAAAEDE